MASHLEMLENAINRENTRITESVVVINNVNDIISVIRTIQPELDDSNETTVKTEVNGEKLSVNLKSKSRRDILFEELQKIRMTVDAEFSSGIQVGDVVMKPVKPIIDNSQIDVLIKKWLGAERRGYLICWDVGGKSYEYNIFTHSLVLKDE